MATTTAIIAGAAVTSAGLGIYNALNTPSSPDTGTAPPPANYIAYNSDGTIASTQTWDASKNAYVYTPNPQPTPSNYGYSGSTDPNDSGYQSWLQTSQGQKYNSDNNTWNTSQQAAAQNKQQVTALENQMLSNLSQTPADRTQAYADYAKAYSNAMHTNVDYQYNKATQAAADTMNARGMMGSKAYADTMGDLNWNKQQSDTQIADQATVASENLANVDKTYWSNLYGELRIRRTLARPLPHSRRRARRRSPTRERPRLSEPTARRTFPPCPLFRRRSTRGRAWRSPTGTHRPASRSFTGTARKAAWEQTPAAAALRTRRTTLN